MSQNDESIVVKYAVNHNGGFDTRHEAVAYAAKLNRQRDDQRRDATVWPYQECGCDVAVTTLTQNNLCGQCGATIPYQ